MHGRSGLVEARAALERHWGYPDFRFAQRKAVVASLVGRDALAMLPTGGGKSLCFQVPALVLPGTTIVVSPLISLMQDQVDALVKRDIGAAYLSSAQRPAEQRAVWERFVAGRLKLLYVAPERLGQLVERRGRVPISRLAVDEAHCISEWGHEFRPHYRAIGRHRRALDVPPTLAVTATATLATRDDIVRVLGLTRPVRITSTFDRPNLRFAAVRVESEGERLRRAFRFIRRADGSSIAYVPTRNRTDGVARVFRQWGVTAYPYHAGLPNRDRRELLERFVAGEIRVMVATNALGFVAQLPLCRRERPEGTGGRS